MVEDQFNYADRAQTALLGVVRDVIAEAAKDGLPGEHHFYITYNTQADGVVITERLRKIHPEEITIVLQNQFEELAVHDDYFTVRLSFNQQPETLSIPFNAITKFYDPSVSFGLMFDNDDLSPETDALHETGATQGKSESSNTMQNETTDEKPGEIIHLDSFRDK